MNEFQKTIKFLAMAFGILLAVGIITAIAGLAVNIISAVTGNYSNEEKIDFDKEFTGVENLDIKHIIGELHITTGDTFRVKAQNVSESFLAEVTGKKTLTVSERSKGFFFLWFEFDGFRRSDSKVTVYLPDNFIADEVKIDSGAGNVNIDALVADKLNINAGTGNIQGSSLSAEEVDIDGGVGNITLTDIDFRDTVFDSGIGNMKLKGMLTGDNKFDCGIGDVDLELKGRREDYRLDIDSGIGTIRLDGDKVSDNYKNRYKADHFIEIDGGIGNVRIDFIP